MLPLAQLHKRRGRPDQALALCVRLHEGEAGADPGSAATAAAAGMLAMELQERGKYDEARGLLEQMLSILAVRCCAAVRWSCCCVPWSHGCLPCAVSGPAHATSSERVLYKEYALT